MPCTRVERQRPRFEPIALPCRPVVPVGELSSAAPKPSQISPGAVTTTGKQLERQSLRVNLFCADEIVRGLFLGTSSDACRLEDLERNGIRNILNVAGECEFPEDVLQAEARGLLTLKKVHMVDHSDHDISKAFPECNDFILTALQRGEGVLVHCRMGVSRSASIVIAFLMQYGGIFFPSKQRNFEHRSQVIAAIAAGACKSANLPQPYNNAISYASESPQMNTNPHRVASRDNIAMDYGVGSKSPSGSSTTTTTQQPLAAGSTSSVATASAELLRQCDGKQGKIFPLTYGDAFDIVKEHRSQIAPNLGFCLALREIDVERGALENIWDFSDAVGL
jgi:hypothetical protein